MIDFYATISPNVLKVAILLEEAGLDYSLNNVKVLNGENFSPDFLKLNPLAKVPVIVEHDGPAAGQPIFESGAILIYLAETYKSEFLRKTAPQRWEVLQWLMFQMSLVGPMMGQVNHFHLLPSEHDGYALGRYLDQTARLLKNIDIRLRDHAYIAGSEYTIADISIYPWMGYIVRHGFNEGDYPGLIRWRNELDARPAVGRAVKSMKIIASQPVNPPSQSQFDEFFARREKGPDVNLEQYIAKGPMFSANPVDEIAGDA